MSSRSEDHDFHHEQDLLEEELLPELEDRLDGYTIEYLSDESTTEFQEVAKGEKSFEEYSYPTIHTAEYGVVFPEYFVVREDSNIGYAAAIEPHTKYIDVVDDELEEPLREFADEWKEATNVKEIDLGKADVSRISFENSSSKDTFATRI